MAVGKVKPEAIVSSVPQAVTRKTFPVAGVGKGLPVVFSRIYSRPLRSYACLKLLAMDAPLAPGRSYIQRFSQALQPLG
jgi:hypothetical protein